MLLFTTFLFAIGFSLFLCNKYVFSLAFFIISIFIGVKKIKDKKRLFTIIFIFVVCIALIFFAKKFLCGYGNIFLVIERKENYCILTDFLNRYYCKTKYLKDYIDEFDLVRINYSYKNFSSITLESGFNFQNYLLSKGIEKEIIIEQIEIISNFPVNNYLIKSSFFSSIKDENVRKILEVFLFSASTYDTTQFDIIKKLNIINLFSFSGIYINMLLYSLTSILEYFFSTKTSKILSLFLCFPLFFINISKFIVRKCLITFLFSTINEYYLNKSFERIELISSLGLIFLLFNCNYVLNDSFILTNLIGIVHLFLLNIYGDKSKLSRKFITNFYLMILILPFAIKFSNSFNLMSFFLIFILLPITKIIFYISILIFLIGINGFFEDLLVFSMRFINNFPGSSLSIHVPQFDTIFYLIYYLVFFAFVFYKEINRKNVYKTITVTSIVCLFVYCLPISNYMFFSVSFINVGQGDSTLIQYENRNYLIDTGGLTYTDIAKNNLIPYFKSKRIYNIESVFITHSDFDHEGALESLQKSFPINNVYTYDNFDESKTPFLLKNHNNFSELRSDENDKSLVLELNVNNVSFLFMGDASQKIEKEILKFNPGLDVDYIKIGHHGSKSSSNYEFLSRITPKEAIISCGIDNRYNHPNEEVLERLNKLNIRIRRTDLEGTIEYKFYNF